MNWNSQTGTWQTWNPQTGMWETSPQRAPAISGDLWGMLLVGGLIFVGGALLGRGLWLRLT